MNSLAAVVLAAGKSTRFRSKLVKILHPIAGVPMIHYTLRALAGLGAGRVVLVTGHGAQLVQAALVASPVQVETCLQEPQLGTGHALMQSRALLEGSAATILCLYGDMPLLTAGTLRRLCQRHQDAGATITLLTVVSQDSMGFGRIVRDERGRVTGIVEEAVAGPEQRAITELNVGLYCFDAGWLWPHLDALPLGPTGEYFLTDTIAQAVTEGRRVEAVAAESVAEVMGVNTRVQLAQAERLVQEGIRQRLMLSGVTLLDPSTVYADATVQVEADTVILPNTILRGVTSIGEDCLLGPGTYIADSSIGRGCRVASSVIEASVVAEGVSVGPFSHLRAGTVVEAGAYIGNFAEIKNSVLGAGSHMGHFGYLGDATVGQRVNYSAGVITCNYDGSQKHPTVIGDDAFLGSDTLLRAPVRVGKRAWTGAGAVVTHDVPDDALAVGQPARLRPRKA